MNDIANELLELLKKDYEKEVSGNKTIQLILKKTKEGTADYTDSLKFAKEIGNCVEKAFTNNINDETLPDSKMYYDLAKALIEPMCKENYKTIAAHCAAIQTSLNKKANIGLQAIKPEYNEEKTEGIINYISSANKYSEREQSFLDSLSTNAKAIVDDSVKQNAEFHYQAGLSPKIVRTPIGKTCKWCQEVAGVYEYGKVKNTGNVVFRRHANCDCTVVYDPSDGSNKVQNVYSKKIEYKVNDEEIKKRKMIGVNQSYGEDVTPFYFGTAKPRQGKFEYDEGYKINDHKLEVEVANILFKNFGGNIRLLNESEKVGQMTADYLWNGKLWDLKTVTTEKSADSAIRKGLKQIVSNQGGVILDYRGKNINQENLIKIIDTRMRRGNYKTVDIMTILKEDKIKIYRYKK